MHGIISLGWFYWDPSREIFRLPIVDRPLGWYGACFVLGFILGYFIILPIFKRKLLETRNLLERDIQDWPLLVKDFKVAQNSPDPWIRSLHLKLSPEAKKQLSQLQFMQEPDSSLKATLLQTLNELKGSRSRIDLETLFPQTIIPLKQLCVSLADRITWFVTVGTLVGARLGEIFFYDWPHYREHPLDMIKIWEGGLASHGGVIGILIAIFLFHRSIKKKFPEFSILTILDCLCIPASLGAFWIRIGNFFNQEIIGTYTTVPWAVVFGHPVYGQPGIPRHPVQLYEAFSYLAIFTILYCLWRFEGKKMREGALVGIFFALTFSARFFLEFFKLPMSHMLDESFLQTGQYLSIPFVILGLILIFYSCRNRKQLQMS
ncbi:prolipoprotein diacylglyceryl transferase [Parachlamydia acanthamoebae UV-7]|jgi:prolipoprotein diacylglyceryl transferase|uniref:Phosphatidylglycerol--prolipoprotein diacylglyceryl transferase n=3 Tax=Parachlamydia acanthamoebae TaxID=83552 RepID=F8KWR6_PARAV|nr:prolipoprotein diacylglyceryl transferase [Parachlamydia acanthamoebae]CCB86196.1 prolipoprotein diacylglyceryl transferase [Parachlamydia acanthamoebae UV-7]